MSRNSNAPPAWFYLFMVGCIGFMALMVSVNMRNCEEIKKKCEQNALVKGRVELKCQEVEHKRLGHDILVTGCGKSVTYECNGRTPEKEGSRAARRAQEKDDD